VKRSQRFTLAAAAIALALALTALTGGRFTAHTGYAEAAREVLGSEWWTLWAVPPVEITLIALLATWLVARIRAAEPDRAGSRRRFAAGAVVVLVVAVCSPIGGLAQGGLLAAHMLQHVLIGAVAPLLVLLALPPRPDADHSDRRSALRRLAHPVPAFASWVLSTVVWLLPGVHHQVLTHVSLWVVQQMAFFAFGALLWSPIVERPGRAPRWFGTGAKCGYMYGVFAVGLILANTLWFSGTAFYASHAAVARAWGLDPLQDQANAGTVMMATHCLLAFGAIAVLFFRRAAADDREQGLREAGGTAAAASGALHQGGLGTGAPPGGSS
jgi:cytochrome c oxidase assembly factor CtaG